jgi:hypothetical protein
MSIRVPSFLRGHLLVVAEFGGAVLLGFALAHIVNNSQIASAGASATGEGTSGVIAESSSSSFTITGNAARPLSPGLLTPLDLSFTNLNDVSMSVTDLAVTVREVSAPNADGAHPCAATDFAVDQSSSDVKITVAARATSSLSRLDVPHAKWPQVSLLQRPVNQDGCKGASLTLAFAASGTLDQ